VTASTADSSDGLVADAVQVTVTGLDGLCGEAQGAGRADSTSIDEVSDRLEVDDMGEMDL
jgi:hypothetical protein